MGSAEVTLVTYHYVRPLAGSRFPQLKALDLAAFESQLDYLSAHYRFVGTEEVMAAFRGEGELPPKGVLLTFDDGYADHFRYVLPRLLDRGISGAFFVTATAALDRQLMDVNRIQFTLASTGDIAALVAELEAGIEAARSEFALKTLDQYRAELMRPNRFDGPQVAYVKRLLQAELPAALRERLAAGLFRRAVTADESGFVEELYMGSAELRAMDKNGMHVGLHSNRHVWLDQMNREEQAAEVAGSKRICAALGRPDRGFSFCAPYGRYNADTLDVLRREGCAFAVTTRSAVARLTDPPLEVPRLDTNELPKA